MWLVAADKTTEKSIVALSALARALKSTDKVGICNTHVFKAIVAALLQLSISKYILPVLNLMLRARLCQP